MRPRPIESGASPYTNQGSAPYIRCALEYDTNPSCLMHVCQNPKNVPCYIRLEGKGGGMGGRTWHVGSVMVAAMCVCVYARLMAAEQRHDMHGMAFDTHAHMHVPAWNPCMHGLCNCMAGGQIATYICVC